MQPRSARSAKSAKPHPQQQPDLAARNRLDASAPERRHGNAILGGFNGLCSGALLGETSSVERSRAGGWRNT